ncbi:MAG: site-specific integrase [Eubacterium sp.]|nr:site-specific integrase [Eubacterium sp.]
MYVRNIVNEQNKPVYLLMNDDNTVVMEVLKYVMHLARTGKSKYTMRNACHNLKQYYEWLSENDLTYLDVVSGKDKSAVEYLTDFVMWLKYPNYDPKIISFNQEEIKAERTNNTINQKMSTIYGFYDYLSLAENLPELKAYKTLRQKMPNHSFLSEMVRAREVRSPVLKLKAEPRRIKYITREDYWKIYKACTCRRDRIICGLLLDGAMRVSEVVGLRIEDAKALYEGKMQIKKRTDPGNPDAAVKYDSEGIVFIPDYLKKEIAAYLVEISDIDTNYLIFNQYGDNKYQPMKTDTIRKMLIATAKRAGLEKHVTPHMFRHGAAVEMADKIATESTNPDSEYYGLQMVDIKDRLRHSSMESTKIYAEFTEAGSEAMAKAHLKAVDEEYTESGIEALVDAIIGGNKNG